MCVSPSQIHIQRGPGYEQQAVPCKLCWRCRSNRVNDYVGRCLSEAAFSEGTIALTLTYAPNPDGSDRADLAERHINPLHFQKFIRSLRMRGHSLKYIVAGEYGAKKGRVHFHALLFFKTPLPKWPQRKHFNFPQTENDQSPWPHGHCYADYTASEKAIRYVCKYLLKYDETEQGWFSMSKKPLLGWDFINQKAELAASYGVMPSKFEYMPPGGTRGRSYLLSGAARREYLRLILQYREEHQNPVRLDRDRIWHGKHTTLSEWTSVSLDAMERVFHQRRAAKAFCAFGDFVKLKDKLDRDRPTLQSVEKSLEFEDNGRLYDKYLRKQKRREMAIANAEYARYIQSVQLNGARLRNGAKATRIKDYQGPTAYPGIYPGYSDKPAWQRASIHGAQQV